MDKHKNKLEIIIIDESTSSENPGFDVDVFSYSEEESDWERDESLTKNGFPTKEEANMYVQELKNNYDITVLD